MRVIHLTVSILLTSGFVFAACGGCAGDHAESKPKSVVKEKTTINTLVTTVGKDGNIEGLVITSCGICNLGIKKGGCSLSVKIGDDVYAVEGTSIHDHGDAHASDGFCSALRVAWAKGKIKDNIFHASSFVLVGS